MVQLYTPINLLNAPYTSVPINNKERLMDTSGENGNSIASETLNFEKTKLD